MKHRESHLYFYCDTQEMREEKYSNENGLVSKKPEGEAGIQWDSYIC